MSKKKLINPISKDLVFAVVPALTLRKSHTEHYTTQSAPVHLAKGRHHGAHSGFGAAHIWAEHKSDILKAGFYSESDVPSYVASILASPNDIYFENRKTARNRVNAVRIVTGTVVLEYIRTIENQVEKPYWSIVTAYSTARTKGVLVGHM